MGEGLENEATMNERPATPLLDTVHIPEDLRRLKPNQLRQLADELRAETISAVGTEVQPARCPQVAAPAAEPPISAIW